MKKRDLKILYLSSFPPRKCGIATFCENFINAVHNRDSYIDQKVIAVNEMTAPKRAYSLLVKYQLPQEELECYDKVAAYVNESGADVFCLQHEYGLFGGFDGIFILKLLQNIKIPIVSVYHSIPMLKGSKRKEYRLKILKDIARFSKFVIVTADIGKKVLIKECKIPTSKIVTIHHGAPAVPYPTLKEKEKLKEKFNLRGRLVMSSFGLISKSKGFDYGVEAMLNLSKKYPNLVFLILGQAHPIHANAMEKDYYSSLLKKVEKFNLKNNILFIGRYLSEEELVNYLRLTDIYLTSYLTKPQISSGTIAYAMATGNCVVSTPFIYAKELIGKDRGYYINFGSSDSIVKVVSDLIDHPRKIEKAREKAYEFGRQFTWPEVAKKIIQVFQRAMKK